MAQKTLDEWAEDFSGVLAKLEDWEFLSDAALHTMMYAVECQVKAWRDEVLRGGPERRKAARHKARKRGLAVEGQQELGFDR